MALTTVNVGYQHREFVDSTCASEHVNAQLGRCDGREGCPIANAPDVVGIHRTIKFI